MHILRRISCMETNKAVEIVKSHLTEARFEHTLRVRDTALKLAEVYEAPEKTVELAAIFHDYAKNRPLDELKQWILSSQLPKDLLDFHHELWHGPVGAILIEREHGLIDSAVQSAIACHTTGKAHMTPVDMIVFVADYIEPGRNFPGLEEVRETAGTNLVKAAWMVSRNSINYLMEKHNTIYPDSFHAYNDLTRQINGGVN